MPAVRFHSQVFAATRAVREAIAAVGLPAHPITGLIPVTSVAAIGRDQPGEWVAVVNDVGEDATIEWKTMGRLGRDERFLLTVRITSLVDGQSDVATESRLEGLAEAVQSIFFEPDTATFIPPDLGGAQVVGGGVSRVSFGVWATDEGFVGQADVQLEVRARI